MRFSTRFCGLLTLLLASSATLAAGHGSGTTVHARRLEKRQVKLDVSDLQQLGEVLGVDLPTVSAGPIEVGPIEVPPVVVDPSPAPTEDDEILIPPPTSTTPEPTPEVPAPSPSAPVSSDPAPTSNDPVGSDPVSTPASSDPVSTPASSEPASTPASTDPASTTDAPTSSAAEPSTTPGGILSSILAPITSAIVDPITSAVLPPVSSAVSEIVDPITSAVLPPVSSVVSEIVDTVTSVIDPVTSAVSSVASEIVDPVTSVIVDPITSVVSDVVSTITSDVVPPVSSVISDIPSVITDVPPVITDVSSVVSSVITNLPSEITDPPLPSTIFSEPPVSEPTPDTSSAQPSQPSQPPISEPTPDTSSVQPSQPSQPPISEPTPDTSSVQPSQPSSVTPSSTIVFPTGSVEPEEPSSAVPSESVSPSSIVVDPGLSFVLTETSLALAPVTTSRSVDPTLSDPDQETTSVATSEFAPTASTTISVAALPTGLPNKIYPVNRLSAESDLEGMTLISILFSSLLNWPFVVSDELSSSQLFAFVPVLITSGLEIGSDSVKTYALQVHIPTTYRSPQDAAELGTMWLGYIPTDQVDTLAALIKAKNSRFYTAAPNPVARALAQHVNTGFNLVSVRDPIGGGSGGDSSGTGQSGATSDGSKSRQDAIIGVVSALGAIALLVLVFLVYRSLKRRKEMAHRRLSDPPGAADLAGYRQEGREFDQDSIGGQRRRSFYFAQDSLRQGQAQDESYSYLQHQPQQGGGYGATAYGGGQQQMSQRRGMPQGGAISAPILQQSSMNW
ncbi:hypothetical protein BKA70DRAFT_860931 [Coprinopsis sp. MPI-PUGE-AT-0042]|nr:hypothetical protein BKA70DRAFT_860931 [Coprinopsis sp. MPI-PUGE-AT-0042]